MQISKFFRKKLFIFIFFYLSLVLSFLLNENSSGGAKMDFFRHIESLIFLKEIGFKEFFIQYEKLTNAHSPVLTIYFYLLDFGKENIILRLFNLHLSLIIPLVFYYCLKIKYPRVNEEYLFLFSCLIFISPYFRSLAIWPGSENISLLFFLLSIIFFLKYELKNDRKYILLNVVFLAISSYFRPYYCIFSLFYFYVFFLKARNKENILIYIILNIILSFPAFYYIFVFESNFIYTNLNNSFNFINSIILTISLLVFYLTPFLIKNIKIRFSLQKLLIATIITLIFILIFNYNEEFGGGVLFHFSKLVLKNNLIFFILTFFSILIIINFFQLKFQNLLLFLVLSLLELDDNYFQETYDPLIFIVMPLFLENEKINKLIEKNNFILLKNCYFFYILFYIIAVSKHYLFKI